MTRTNSLPVAFRQSYRISLTVFWSTSRLLRDCAASVSKPPASRGRGWYALERGRWSRSGAWCGKPGIGSRSAEAPDPVGRGYYLTDLINRLRKGILASPLRGCSARRAGKPGLGKNSSSQVQSTHLPSPSRLLGAGLPSQTLKCFNGI